MTRVELEAIRRRDEEDRPCGAAAMSDRDVDRALFDRAALLLEVDRLTDELENARVEMGRLAITPGELAKARREGVEEAWTLAVAAVEQYGAWKPLIGHTAVQLVQAARNDHLKELP